MNEASRPIFQLPYDKNHQIFSMLDINSFLNCMSVSKNWLAFCSEVAITNKTHVDNRADFQWLMLKLNVLLKAYVAKPQSRIKFELEEFFAKAVKGRMNELKKLLEPYTDFSDYHNSIHKEGNKPKFQYYTLLMLEIAKLTKLLFDHNLRLSVNDKIQPSLSDFNLWFDFWFNPWGNSEHSSLANITIHFDYWLLSSGTIAVDFDCAPESAFIFSVSNAKLNQITFVYPREDYSNDDDYFHYFKQKIKEAASILDIRLISPNYYDGNFDVATHKALNLIHFEYLEKFYFDLEIEESTLQKDIELHIEHPLIHHDKPVPLAADSYMSAIHSLKLQNAALAKKVEILTAQTIVHIPALLHNIGIESFSLTQKNANEQIKTIIELRKDIAELNEKLRLLKQQSGLSKVISKDYRPNDELNSTKLKSYKLLLNVLIESKLPAETANFEDLISQLTVILTDYLTQPNFYLQNMIARSFSNAVKLRMDELKDYQDSIKSSDKSLEYARAIFSRFTTAFNEIVELTDLLYDFNQKLTNTYIIRPSIANFTLWLASDEINDDETTEHMENPIIHLDYWILSNGLINYETKFTLSHASLLNIIFAESSSKDFAHIKGKLRSALHVYNIHFLYTLNFGDYLVCHDDELDAMNAEYQQKQLGLLIQKKKALENDIDQFYNSAIKNDDNQSFMNTKENEFHVLTLRNARLKEEIAILTEHDQMQRTLLTTSIYDYEKHPAIQTYLDTLKNKITVLQNEIQVLKTDLAARNKPFEQPQEPEEKSKAVTENPDWAKTSQHL